MAEGAVRYGLKKREKKADNDSAAKTGDDTPLALLIALAGVSVIALVACVTLKKNKD